MPAAVNADIYSYRIAMISNEAARTAGQCRHYSMCKIDYLGTGLCPAGAENHFVSYYPQGRMDLVKAVAAGKLPVTERLVEIAETCTLCGICDLQCHFISELRPLPVMKELKKHVKDHLAAGKPVLPEFDDKSLKNNGPLLNELREITGPRWASNDSAITTAYYSDPCPVTIPKLPRAVVLPKSVEDVEGIVLVAKKHGVPFMVRGNGSSVMGFVMTDGILIDTQRMKTVDFDADNWCVTVGAGVSAFDLQKEAFARGYRVNVAEPAALVCANLMCSGIMSLFYLDQNDPDEIQASRRALGEAAELIEKTSASVTGVQWIRYTLNQGCCRKEDLLYSL